MITMLLSYLGHGGPGGNSSDDEEKEQRVNVDMNELTKKSGTKKNSFSVLSFSIFENPNTLVLRFIALLENNHDNLVVQSER